MEQLVIGSYKPPLGGSFKVRLSSSTCNSPMIWLHSFIFTSKKRIFYKILKITQDENTFDIHVQNFFTSKKLVMKSMRSIENHDTLSSNIQQLTLILWIQKIKKKQFSTVRTIWNFVQANLMMLLQIVHRQWLLFLVTFL